MKKITIQSVLTGMFLLSCTFASHAQVSGMPFAAALDSFSVISGTVLDAPGVDDAQYGNLNIGFNFIYGGQQHSKFTVSTNGYIELDTLTQVMFFNPLNGARNNIISPYGADLKNTLPNASIQYTTIGMAPNRITIIQWLHYSYFGGMNGDLNFQIRLYESSNCISFVYGANTLTTTPLHTQIGLRGDTITDFIALGDTSCNWASAYPYPSINTNFPVSLSCSMPSGFAFEFGACIHGGSPNFGYITGKVFNDQNGNAIADAGEPGIQGNIISVMPGNYYVSSDAGGNYAFFFFDSTITYTITASPKTWWNFTSPSSTTILPMSQPCNGNNFGLQIIPNIHEVQISTINWNAKPGQPEPMPITYFNNGTSVESDSITFIMDSLYSFISSTPAPFSVTGQTITWLYSNLQPGQSGHISLNLLPSANAVLGNFLNSTLTIYPIHNDTIPGNNVFQVQQLLSNSWDPNDKIVEPEGMIPAGSTLNYTIRFQNTGNAFADNVSIIDNIDAGLDPMTFKLTGYSHPLNYTINGNGTATFTFFNIQLPDSGSDFAGSNGYVKFSIRARNNLAPLTVINNTAEIYFDFNPAVITNTVSDTIQSISTGIEKPETTGHMIASPNPAGSQVAFVFSDNQMVDGTLTIFSIDGKIAFQKEHIRSGEPVELSVMAKGIYFCSVRTISGVHVVKLMKE